MYDQYGPDNSIRLEKIETGWLVTLPFMGRAQLEPPVAMARAMKKEFDSDPILSHIQNGEEKPKFPLTQNTFAFDSFEKVLVFLATKNQEYETN